MAHYAILDENNAVIDVFVGIEEDDLNYEDYYTIQLKQRVRRTSYNTLMGVHYDPDTQEPSADQSKSFRKNYAGKGYFYDKTRDAFIPPKPYDSWTLNEDTCQWEPPVARPETGDYIWDELNATWVEFNINS